MGSPKLALDAYLVSIGERSLIGSFTYTADDFTAAATWIGQAPPPAVELISRVVPLTEGAAAFAELAGPADIPGKVLVRMDETDPGEG
jgi:hypothetical protein